MAASKPAAIVSPGNMLAELLVAPPAQNLDSDTLKSQVRSRSYALYRSPCARGVDLQEQLLCLGIPKEVAAKVMY